MRNLFFALLCPFLIFGSNAPIPSKIKYVTVYLSGAQISRTATFIVPKGTSEFTFPGLSTGIDESSIQISGLQSVSILSMAYNINYLEKKVSNPEITTLENLLEGYRSNITLLKNKIAGLVEEELVITSNRKPNASDNSFDLEKVKQISTYYRQRITAIRDTIFRINQQVDSIDKEVTATQNQLSEIKGRPQEYKGELKIKLDTNNAAFLNLNISYTVVDAGWIPTYDIKSKQLNAPLNLTYKAQVYQNTGNDWENVKIFLSTGSPYRYSIKPSLETKYLNFIARNTRNTESRAAKRHQYSYNPTVKRVTGIVTDASGQPLPGCAIVIKGTSKGTRSNIDGYYTLSIDNEKELVFSYLGFSMESVPIYSSVMNIKMEEDSQALDEVVVTGFSKQSSILQGRLSGVQIRGESTKPGDTSPLYIIDGVPVEGFVEGDLAEDEIASLEVLKGEQATAIYGNKASNGVMVITTVTSTPMDEMTNTKFVIKKPYSLSSNDDITTIEINSFELEATYEYFAVPLINENVFLVAKLKEWEKYDMLPGEANLYFEGSYAGKTVIDPYTLSKELNLSFGIDAQITVTRTLKNDFKNKSLLGSNKIIDRAYELEVKNNKTLPIQLRLLDRIPISQNKEIKVEEINVNEAKYDSIKGIITWNLNIDSKDTAKTEFSYQVKYPRYKSISL
ncbi:MAG: TonB-dependent SusC/RagA subfamily outer membrane receptor [Psychroserpens sp.]|jgi:TonB-dependent SusC/RagA subfamily outer membrane receptor